MYSAAVFLPLLGAIVVGLFGRSLGDRASQWITSGLLIVSAVLATVIFAVVGFSETPRVVTIEVLSWVQSGSLDFSWSLRYDTLTAVMVFVVTVVSALVHVYSIGYMHHDPCVPRFMAYLSLFTFAMLMLVTADNFLQLFMGWEGVGLCSYLLIGFWYDRPSANAAAIKAFLVNRVGDLAFALGFAGAFALFDSVQFAVVLPAAKEKAEVMWHFLGMDINALTTICPWRR